MTEPLCITCSKAVPQLCNWINAGDRTGLEYKTRIAPAERGRKCELVMVTGCSEYVKGQLPPIEWRG